MFAAFAVLCAACGDSSSRPPFDTSDPPADPPSRYRELIDRFHNAWFQITFDYEDGFDTEQEVLRWTKRGSDQRLDLVWRLGTVVGITDLHQRDNEMSCFWAWDDDQRLFDADCSGGVTQTPVDLDFWFENVDGLARPAFIGNTSVAGYRTECFELGTASVIQIGIVCLSDEGYPLWIEIDQRGRGHVRLRADLIRESPPLADNWLQPIIPGATYSGDTRVDQVPASQLAVPDLPPISELLREQTR